MTTILLYSPDVVGHPRVYCRVIADALSNENCDVVVAMGFTDAAGLAQSTDLQPLASRNRVQLIDNRSRGRGPHLTAEELVALQEEFQVSTTLFIEADKSNDEFRRIAAGAAPQLKGRNLGIFANTAEWYPGEGSFTGEPKRFIAPTLRTTLGNVKRALFERKKSIRYFYEQSILAKGVLDEILVKDERLAEWFGPPVYWMPEISRPVVASETEAEAAEYERRRAELQQFLAHNTGREPVLYFGDAAFYKGYDLFLEFTSRTPNTAVIHAGRTETYDTRERSRFQYDVEAIRKKLKEEGRLYETASYVHTQRLKQLYFESVRLYITTHRLALSSATVIQAADFHRPVLVPDRGLLGHRVRMNHLGDVYEYGNLDDLAVKAQALWQSDLSRFTPSLERFYDRFSDESIRRFFSERLLH